MEKITFAYFVDLDGTLLDAKDKNGKPEISLKNLNVIEKVQKDNKAIVVSTGRGLFDARKWLQEVNSPFAVLSNGAIVVVKDQVVRHLKLSIRQGLLLHEFAWKNKLAFKLNDEKTAWGVTNKINRFFAERAGFIAKPNYNFEMHKEYTKFVMWGRAKKKEIAILIDELKVRIPDVSIVTSSGGYTIEITHKNATKGEGNELIWRNYLNLNIDQTMHIGDTMNDSTAIGHVGKLVAMKNADKKLKALTKYIGPNFKNGGVSKVLEGKFKEVKQR